MDRFLTDFVENLTNGDPTAIGIVVALVIGLLSIFLILCSGTSNQRRGILLVGLCDSGKTLLFSRLVYKQYKKTQTSIKENQGSYDVPDSKKAPLKIVDLPGHERLRNQSLDQYKGTARGIIFVVDSLTFQKDMRDVAEYLYTILTDVTVSKNHPPLLIACNKHDQTLAKGSKVIQDMLEKEMNTLRKTKAAALDTTDNTSSSRVLGGTDRDFSFRDAKPFQMDFAECSAQGNKDYEPEINQILDWLDRIA